LGGEAQNKEIGTFESGASCAVNDLDTTS
jgi:hypothetical protein